MDAGMQVGMKLDNLSRAASLLSDLKSWTAAAGRALSDTSGLPEAQRPHLDQIDELLQKYGDFGMELSEAAPLLARQVAGYKWVVRAQRILDQKIVQLDMLQVGRGLKLKFEFGFLDGD